MLFFRVGDSQVATERTVVKQGMRERFGNLVRFPVGQLALGRRFVHLFLKDLVT